MVRRFRRKMLGSLFALTLLAGLGLAGMARAEGEAPVEKTGTPKAHWPQKTFEFAPIMEGSEITHDFVVENKGNAPLDIHKVQPD